MKLNHSCYWRFKDEKIWHYGWISSVMGGLIRLGAWNGDTENGVIVDPDDVEIRQL